MQCLSPLAKHLFTRLPKLGQPEMTSVNLQNCAAFRPSAFYPLSYIYSYIVTFIFRIGHVPNKAIN